MRFESNLLQKRIQIEICIYEIIFLNNKQTDGKIMYSYKGNFDCKLNVFCKIRISIIWRSFSVYEYQMNLYIDWLQIPYDIIVMISNSILQE